MGEHTVFTGEDILVLGERSRVYFVYVQGCDAHEVSNLGDTLQPVVALDTLSSSIEGS